MTAGHQFKSHGDIAVLITSFREALPIRSKFNVMTAVHAVLVSCAVASGYLAAASASIAMLCVAIGFIAISAAVSHFIFKPQVCDPYVNTVLRMEALAQGDTQSEISYLHHTTDCVGRMAHAMLTFKDNAERVEAASKEQRHTVNVLKVALDRLSNRDLSHNLDEDLPADAKELQTDFNHAVNILRETLASVAETAEAVQTGAREIRSASDDLANRTERQASQVEQTLSEMTSLSNEVSETANDAEAVNQKMLAAKEKAQHSGEVVERAVIAMSGIEEASKEIASIVDIIDGIAFQTNLLALNAGVEAARAGETGKGFAVVASEVRALAQRAAEAAQDIKAKVSTSQDQVASGVSLVSETSDALENIVRGIIEMNELVSKIGDSTRRQSSGLEAVNSAASQIDVMTQQNAAMVEEATAATRNLAGVAEDLTSRLSSFNLGIVAGGAPMHDAGVKRAA